jgi:filamentous hemagglutinin family protein
MQPRSLDRLFSRCLIPVLLLGAALAGVADAAPEGGVVVSGAGSIAQDGAVTTIRQVSNNLSLTWKSFNTSATESVVFDQPSSSSIAVNRIYDVNGTSFLGRMTSNGQVFLINPNGIIFGPGAQLNVGSLVASTLELDDTTLGSSKLAFSGAGSGRILNQGTIETATGGYIAFLGKEVSNAGTLLSPQGTVALAGGDAITLSFDSNRLLNVQVDQSTLDNLAENRQLIRADGGKVILTAGARNSVLASAVNNTGIIEARTVEDRNGTIILLGGMEAGIVNVDGTLDASAPNGGNGGFVETSAAHVKISDTARVTTLAPMGNSGEWLIDPVDFVIASTGGDMTGAAATSALAGGDLTIASTSGSTGSNGDLFVNDGISWSTNRLTLSASRDINIDATLNGTGTAKLSLLAGQAGNIGRSVFIRAPVNLPAGANLRYAIAQGGSTTYTVITSLGAENSVTGSDLQGMDTITKYALGSDIDAQATSGWTGGFKPIGIQADQFTGQLMGLGHTISNLTINRPAQDYVGLLGYVSTSNMAVSNLKLISASITGHDNVGGIVGLSNQSNIQFSSFSGSVTGNNYVGGLVGSQSGGVAQVIQQSYSQGSVTGASFVGGLVGQLSTIKITDSYSTANVSASSTKGGGLVGENLSGTITNSYATGTVGGGGTMLGGLVGNQAATIVSSYWDTSVIAAGVGNGALSGASGLTTAGMKQQANFSAWDTTDKWIIYEGQSRPLLRAFLHPLKVVANNASKTYDGTAYSGNNGFTYAYGLSPSSALLGTVAYGGTAQGAINADSYTITPSGLYSTTQDGGYQISYTSGTLTVSNPTSSPITVLPPSPPSTPEVPPTTSTSASSAGVQSTSIVFTLGKLCGSDDAGVEPPSGVLSGIEVIDGGVRLP